MRRHWLPAPPRLQRNARTGREEDVDGDSDSDEAEGGGGGDAEEEEKGGDGGSVSRHRDGRQGAR